MTLHRHIKVLTRIEKIIWTGLVLTVLLLANPPPVCAELTEQDQARWGMAQSWNNLRKHDDALPLLRALHTAYPQDSAILLELVKAAGFGSAYDEAQGLIQQLPEDLSGQETWQRTIAAIYEARENFADARTWYQKIFQRVPEDQKLAEKIAILSMWLDDYPAAQDLYRQLMEKNPDNPEFKKKFAEAAFWAKDYPAMIGVYETLGLDPKSDPEAVKRLAAACGRLGQEEKAIAWYQQYLTAFPQDWDIVEKLAVFYQSREDHAQALTLYRQLMDQHPDNRQFSLHYAEAAFWLKDYPTMIKTYQSLALDPMTEPEPVKRLAAGYASLGQYDQAIATYTHYLESFPDDQTVRGDLANTYLATGRRDEAKVEFLRLLEKNPGDTASRLKLAEILGNGRHYAEAIELCNQVLTQEPGNKDALLWRARFASWTPDYNQALDYYQAVIENNPDFIDARLEKARVQGWARNYRDSVEEYRSLVNTYPRAAAIAAELQAKENYYKLHDRQAIAAYHRWLKLEPDNLEALFDLAQAYSRNEQWREAQTYYQRTLELVPSHFRARDARQRVEQLARAPQLEGGLETFEADSGSRNVDEKYLNIYESLTVPLSDHLLLGVREDNTTYFTSELSTFNLQRLWGELTYRDRPRFWFKLGGGYLNYSDVIKNSRANAQEIHVQPVDGIELGLAHKREDVTDNARTFISNLEKDTFSIRLDLRPNRRWDAGADYHFADYNDRNQREGYGLDLTSQLLFEPRRLSLRYRYEAYGFDEPRVDYFSPRHFHTHGLGLEWRHYLNKEELFWGSQDIYYTVRYSLNLDVKGQRGHLLYLDCHKDWNNRLSSHLELEKMIYEHQNNYQRDRILTYLRWLM